MWKSAVLALSFAACDVPAIDLDLNHGGGAVTLYDDGETLLVTGCSDTALIGCNPPTPGIALAATIDGRVVDVPVNGAAASVPEELLENYPYRVAVPSPRDSHVGLAFGDALADAEL